MKIDVEKLKAALAELGLEEGQIEKVVAVSSDEPQEDPEGKSEEENTSSEGPVAEEKPSESEGNEGEDEGVPPQDEVPPESESVPPLPEVPQEEVPVEDVPVEEPPVEEPPVEEPPVEEPPVAEVPPQFVSIEEFAEVKNELAEQKKANEGLVARIGSLEQALKDAGVIDGSVDSSVGVDDPSAPGQTNVDTTLDDIIRDINRKGY